MYILAARTSREPQQQTPGVRDPLREWTCHRCEILVTPGTGRMVPGEMSHEDDGKSPVI